MGSLLVALVASQALLTGSPDGPLYSHGVNALAFFEAFPASGLGAGTACACAAVTGAKGEALTFARASTATCTKSNTSAIANGDLVTCSSNLPRVMSGGDGSGVLGLLVESSRTNVVIQSATLSNTAFADYVGTGGTTASLTGGTAVAPDGTTSAIGYTFAATTGTQASARAETVGPLTAAAYSCQAFVEGQSGSGTTDLCIQTGASTATCAPCAFTNTSWTNCKVQNVTSIASGQFYIGNNSSLNGGTARSSNAVYAWGMDCQLGAYSTSYIPTTTVAVTRAAEGATVDLGATAPPASNTSLAVTLTGKPATSTLGTVVVAYLNPTSFASATGAGLELYSTTSSTTEICQVGSDAAGLFATGTAAGGSGTVRAWCSATTGSTVTGSFAGNAMAASGATSGVFSAARYMSMGGINGTGYQFDSVLKQVCVDPSPSRCR